MDQETARTITPDGWLKTGDLGYLDDDGFLYISGRKTEMIIRAGENIMPAEIESQILQHSSEQAVKVIGIPAEVIQEQIVACVIPAAGAVCSMMNQKKLPQRVLSYCFGLLLMAFGVSLSIKSSLLSMLFVALGLMFYLASDIVPQPAEGVMLALHTKTGIEFSKLKTWFDTIVVVLAGIISLVAFGKLEGVREGTLLAAIGIGKILGILNRYCRKSIEIFLH